MLLKTNLIMPLSLALPITFLTLISLIVSHEHANNVSSANIADTPAAGLHFRVQGAPVESCRAG